MGAGRIAQGYDEPNSHSVLSLAHAVRSSPAFRLGGFFDIVAERAAEAERKWECPPTPRDREKWLDRGWDVVLIATPEEAHATDLRDVLDRGAKAIVVEKPVAMDAEEGALLLQKADRLGIPVLVDYPRRWHSGVAAVRRHIGSGGLGHPVAVLFAYSGPSVRALTHALDLFQEWWGPDWRIRHVGRRGPSVAAVFEGPSGDLPVSFFGFPAQPHYLWEMQVYCEAGKVELGHCPELLEISLRADHPVYPAYRCLRGVEKFDMEGEPLLSRLLGTLRQAVAHPEKARGLLAREMASHAFSARVLKSLGPEAL